MSLGLTTTALQSIDWRGKSFRFKLDLFPTRTVATRRSSIFELELTSTDGQPISATFTIEYQNTEASGLRTPKWEPTGRAFLILREPSGVEFQELELQLAGYVYKTRSAAAHRTARFRGEIVSEDGTIRLIEMNLNERNLEPNGLKPARWERAKSATLYFAP